MAVLLSKKSRVLVQGITGHQGQFHTRAMIDFGTKVVAGVTPGKGGTKVEGVPVFDSVREAVHRRRANASIIFVPAPYAKDAAIEAIEGG
ncbi:MAG TPA: succinate--CoA ligase subunit alpha, partial [Thermoplasmata archaeon]|nr:succinate--CoA ligase subunit alpha [Thermoplasmata archaeon]